MSVFPHGQIRQSQVVTTWGPGALLDLPNSAVIVGGLDTWPSPAVLTEIVEPRMTYKLQSMTGIVSPRLYAPPPAPPEVWAQPVGIGVFRFPEWFIVQEDGNNSEVSIRSRRLVHRRHLDERGRFERKPAVPIRFVRACPRGHIDDIDWYAFVHYGESDCRRRLWLDEQGLGSDLGDLSIRCECGRHRPLYEATVLDENPLGRCSGRRPWLGPYGNEPCNQRSRLLIRTAANAYFPQVLSVLSLPDRSAAVDQVVAQFWSDLQIVQEPAELRILRRKPELEAALGSVPDDEVMAAIARRRKGDVGDRPVKQAELDALLAAEEGLGEPVPLDPDFDARRLPEVIWRRTPLSDKIEAVIQVHRLREVLALAGFTRFEAVTPDIDGEFDTDVERAELALSPTWFPAVENRGEGVFIQLRSAAVDQWLQRPAVGERLKRLAQGHEEWVKSRSLKHERPFPGGPYVLLHTLSHLLIQSLAMTSGYPASSIRERVYVDFEAGRYGILLYTGSPDAEGTLGGLVQQAQYIEQHLEYALRIGQLCSNDPLCAQHVPGESLEQRWLHGAACHGCALIAETSCEMRNDYLDRALVVPVLGAEDSAFFAAVL